MIDNRFAQGEDGLSDNMDLAQTILNSIATIDNISGIEDMHDAISSTLGMIGEKTGAERVYILTGRTITRTFLQTLTNGVPKALPRR